MYNEETQDESAILMKQNNMPMGRLLEGSKDILYNATVSTQEDGPFWYGDIDLATDGEKLRRVASSLGKSLNIEIGDTVITIPAN